MSSLSHQQNVLVTDKGAVSGGKMAVSTRRCSRTLPPSLFASCKYSFFFFSLVVLLSQAQPTTRPRSRSSSTKIVPPPLAIGSNVFVTAGQHEGETAVVVSRFHDRAHIRIVNTGEITAYSQENLQILRTPAPRWADAPAPHAAVFSLAVFSR